MEKIKKRPFSISPICAKAENRGFRLFRNPEEEKTSVFVFRKNCRNKHHSFLSFSTVKVLCFFGTTKLFLRKIKNFFFALYY